MSGLSVEQRVAMDDRVVSAMRDMKDWQQAERAAVKRLDEVRAAADGALAKWQAAWAQVADEIRTEGARRHADECGAP